ncbi:MAG: ribonuclease [Lachnospiraceae bacterium]|nr:ribonuclease [Lachnospiraceae bacterium]
MKKRIGIFAAFAALMLAFMLAACMPARTVTADKPESRAENAVSADKPESAISEDGSYYDLESVVLYYDEYGKLPENYVRKNDAKALGWEGGKLDGFIKDAAIGGDHFGNYEKRLPSDKGIKYIECDIDTKGRGRGAKRLIISNTGKYYYTEDHYESFTEVFIEDGKVVKSN